MKKAYVTPTVEKVEFQYDKVVAASGKCTNLWQKEGTAQTQCTNQEFVKNYFD